MSRLIIGGSAGSVALPYVEKTAGKDKRKIQVNKFKVALVLLVVLLVAALTIGTLRVARASSALSGRWAGTAFADPAFDLNSDGVAARIFNMTTYGQFATMEGVIDSALLSIGSCAPGALELQAFGSVTFRDRTGDSLFTEVPANAPHLCFDPANPAEVISVNITGGTGAYANATGTGSLNVHDIVRLVVPANLPPFGVVPAPTLVDSHGEFTLNLQ